MEHIEVTITNGGLRQPGMWGKVLHANGSIGDLDSEKDVQMSVSKTARKFTFPNYPIGTLLLFRQRGYFTAGQLANCFFLLSSKEGEPFDVQSKQLQVRCQGKGAVLVAQSETDLKPIYEFLDKAKYPHMDRLRNGLKQEGIDR